MLEVELIAAAFMKFSLDTAAKEQRAKNITRMAVAGCGDMDPAS